MKIEFVLRKIIAMIMVSALILFTGTGTNTTAPHTVLDEEDCRLCVSVLSDAHIEGNNFPRFAAFSKMLNDVDNNTYGNDAVLFLGDNTMNGQNIESIFFYGLLAKKDLSGSVLTVCGNHDVGNGNGDYNSLIQRYMNYNNAFLGKKLEKPYYYEIVDGYYFIVLAPEDLCVHTMPISDEQMEFLNNTLAAATADGKPAFVCAHHPYYYSTDDELFTVLKKYNNVFYLSGHTHAPCAKGWTFYEYDGVGFINLPRCTELEGEGDNEISNNTGNAVQLEVYDNEVVGRVRNYYTGEWVDEFEYHFSLTK